MVIEPALARRLVGRGGDVTDPAPQTRGEFP